MRGHIELEPWQLGIKETGSPNLALAVAEVIKEKGIPVEFRRVDNPRDGQSARIDIYTTYSTITLLKRLYEDPQISSLDIADIGGNSGNPLVGFPEWDRDTGARIIALWWANRKNPKHVKRVLAGRTPLTQEGLKDLIRPRLELFL